MAMEQSHISTQFSNLLVGTPGRSITAQREISAQVLDLPEVILSLLLGNGL